MWLCGGSVVGQATELPLSHKVNDEVREGTLESQGSLTKNHFSEII